MKIQNFEILFSTWSSYLFDADHESENRRSKFATVEKLFKVFMASDGRTDGRTDGHDRQTSTGFHPALNTFAFALVSVGDSD